MALHTLCNVDLCRGDTAYDLLGAQPFLMRFCVAYDKAYSAVSFKNDTLALAERQSSPFNQCRRVAGKQTTYPPYDRAS
jgi:hypothetical protein